MKATIEFVFLMSLFVSIMMAGLTYLNVRRQRLQEFSHLMEFWISLTTMMVISYLFHNQNEHIIALSLVGWFWPLKTIVQIAQDTSGLDLINKQKIIILMLGSILTLGLASSGQEFRLYTLPFCLSVGIIGFLILKDVFRKKSGKLSVLQKATFGLLAVFFLIRMSFPIWRIEPDYILYGITLNLMVLIGLSASTLSQYLEESNTRHEKEMGLLLKERNDQLFGQSKYSELGMMSAGIAHEINNPLAIIQAKTTQLLRIYRDPNRQQDLADGLNQILYTSERINRTIQGVRDFVHQDDNLPDENIPLKNLVDDVLAFCGQRMKNHGVNLRFYGLEGFYVRGHKIQLEQVILNLLNNSFDAIEFLPDKWIEMSVHETADTIQMYFKDSGPGIPPEVASRMMEPFFTTKKIGKGTGLGLALARGIVEKHGGSLVYIANAGHTTFMLELPKRGLSRPFTERDSELRQIH